MEWRTHLIVSEKIASGWGTLIGLIRLIRPGNILMVIASVYVGAAIENSLFLETIAEFNERLLFASISAGLVASGANALNDFYDLEIDRINRPDRPLPSLIVMPSSAKLLAAILMLAGIGLGLHVSLTHGIVAALCCVTLWLYNRYLKTRGVAGNLAVAVIAGVTLIYGGLVVGDGSGALTGAVFAFLLTMAREVVKDIEDVKGDAEIGSRSLPVVKGDSFARNFAIAFILVTIIATPLPFASLGFGGLFLIVMVVVNLLLFHVILQLYNGARARKLSTLLKLSMLFGMVGLILGRVGE